MEDKTKIYDVLIKAHAGFKDISNTGLLDAISLHMKNIIPFKGG